VWLILKYKAKISSEGLTEATPGVVRRRQTLGNFPTEIEGLGCAKGRAARATFCLLEQNLCRV